MAVHKKALRHNRGLLLREFPDVATLLSTDHLKPCFTHYEKGQILASTVPSERAAKLLDTVEAKDYELYEKFVRALRPLKPTLASALETSEREIRDSSAASSPCSNGSSASPFHTMDSLPNGQLSRGASADMPPPSPPSQHPIHLHIVNDGDDAGLYGLTGHGLGPAHRLSHLSYAGREFLAERLNGTPQDRNLFNDFCMALGVEQHLIQVSMRSRNPTGYLIQEFSERPDATFERLQRALSDIGQRDLFEQLQAVDSDPMNGGDDV